MAKFFEQDMTTQDIRRRNLKALLDKWGGPTKLGRKLQHSGPSYLSQLKSGNRPITEKTARAIEEYLGLAPGQMDLDPERKKSSQSGMDTALLSRVMALVNRLQRELGKRLRQEKIGEVVGLIYEDAQAKQKIDEAFAIRVLSLAIK